MKSKEEFEKDKAAFDAEMNDEPIYGKPNKKTKHRKYPSNYTKPKKRNRK